MPYSDMVSNLCTFTFTFLSSASLIMIMIAAHHGRQRLCKDGVVLTSFMHVMCPASPRRPRPAGIGCIRPTAHACGQRKRKDGEVGGGGGEGHGGGCGPPHVSG